MARDFDINRYSEKKDEKGPKERILDLYDKNLQDFNERSSAARNQYLAGAGRERAWQAKRLKAVEDEQRERQFQNDINWVDEAMMGASAGSSFGPWGAAIGGGLGMLGGLAKGFEARTEAGQDVGQALGNTLSGPAAGIVTGGIVPIGPAGVFGGEKLSFSPNLPDFSDPAVAASAQGLSAGFRQSPSAAAAQKVQESGQDGPSGGMTGTPSSGYREEGNRRMRDAELRSKLGGFYGQGPGAPVDPYVSALGLGGQPEAVSVEGEKDIMARKSRTWGK